MSAENLIALATSKGYRIGRSKPGVYYYGKGTDKRSFVGSWTEFVKFIKAL